ncbi:MAG: hypothetical protein H0V62_09485 [Gammaproteobacteria bacterium]|nr:hypothetical protein [Gammaproteobacteria bacterium]
MLKAVLIDNGVTGATRYFRDSEQVRYRIERVRDGWSPDFSHGDLVVVPNGADHVALYEVRDRIAAFLAQGGTLACFCGFFTPWIPGNVWVHDNTRPLREVRYRMINDPLDLMNGVELDQLTFESHGISGWWACGHIETAHPESVVLADNFDRVVMIADNQFNKRTHRRHRQRPARRLGPGQAVVGPAAALSQYHSGRLRPSGAGACLNNYPNPSAWCSTACGRSTLSLPHRNIGPSSS